MSLEVLTHGGGGEAASILVTGLSETDSVIASKGGKTARGKWSQKPNPAYIGLPDGYTQLEYIESDGDQYIKSDLTPSDDMRIEATAYKAANADGTSFFGGNTSKPYGCALYGTTGTMQLYCAQTGNINVGAIPYGEWFDFDITVKNGAINIVWNGVSKTGSYSGNMGTDTNFFVFSGGNGNEKTEGLRYKRFKWTRNGSVARDYIPSKRNADGAVGFYDLVSQTFFDNNGAGTFVAGAEIPSVIDGHIIPIKSYGLWTVTATNGEKTATQDVLVDAAVEYEIEMGYYTYIFKNGEEYNTNLTGGLVQSVGGSTPVDLEGNAIRFIRGEPICSNRSDIPFANYSVLAFHIATVTFSNWLYAGVGDANVNPSSSGGTNYAVLGLEKTDGTLTTGWHYLDISEVSQSGAFMFKGNETGYALIDEIYLA